MSGSDAFIVFESVSKFFDEIDSLCKDLSDSVIESLESINGVRPLCEQRSEDYRMSDNDWFVTDYSFSIPLARVAPGRPRAFAYLSFQVSLVGDGTEKAREPLLHVCLWENAIDFHRDFYMGFPLDEGARVVWGRLMTWEDGKRMRPWTYSVKLFSLKNREAIDQLIVAPVMALLRIGPALNGDAWENEVMNALPDTLLETGVFRYQDE